MTAKSKKNNPVLRYLESAMEEYRKITWPTTEQAALLTALVTGFSIFFIVLVGIADLGLNELFTLLRSLV